MRNVLKITGLICSLFVAFSCSKDDDPADNDLFVGTYEGSISYSNEDSDESYDDGSVTVIKLGSKRYDFRFSDGIPNLTNIEFEEDGDHVLVNVDFEEGVTYIRIDESTLKILYTKGDEKWTANATR